MNFQQHLRTLGLYGVKRKQDKQEINGQKYLKLNMAQETRQ